VIAHDAERVRDEIRERVQQLIASLELPGT
jgi:hypothetical protein